MYTNQTTSSLADLISKLNTFLGTTVGTWTTYHNAAGGEFAARKTGSGFDIAFASQWSTASPNHLGIYQWYNAAYNSGVSPWQQTNDSGNGAASTTDATLNTARRAVISNTPQQFWCFEDDHYFHVVVQIDADDYAHFGAGLLDKFNDWTGGEYVYGHRQDNTFTGANAWILGANTMLLDGRTQDTGSTPLSTNSQFWTATVHVEGFANQPANGKWAVCMGNQSSSLLGNDRQGTPVGRIHFVGGYGGGMWARMLSQYRGTTQRALNPMWPILPVYWNRTTDNVAPLGQMKDIRGVNIRDFSPGEEVVIGGDTWVLFPGGRKALADTEGGTQTSGYHGIAYKKVTT